MDVKLTRPQTLGVYAASIHLDTSPENFVKAAVTAALTELAKHDSPMRSTFKAIVDFGLDDKS